MKIKQNLNLLKENKNIFNYNFLTTKFNFSKSNYKMIKNPNKSLFPLHEPKLLYYSNQFRKGKI